MVTEIFETITSTNDYLKEKSKEGVLKPKDGVISFSQTGGRGRLGRSFVSPQGGIYTSFCYDNVSVTDTSYLSIMPSVAAYVSCFIKDTLNLNTEIKWPNDVLYNGKKCSGILVERTSRGDLIIGVGLNYCIKEFDESLKSSAISLFTDLSMCPNIKQIAVSFLDTLRYVKPFSEDQDMYEYYNEHLLYKGKTVTLKTIYNNELTQGECISVNKNGELLLKMTNGDIKYCNAGELTTHLN